MKLISFVSAAVVAGGAVSVALADDGFATLGGVKAAPMAAAELDQVKGLHVHFLDANGGFHVNGNFNGFIHSGKPNNGIGEENWFLNGSPDGQPVHPSYHGLCVAGPIIIPTGPNPSQCP